METIRLSARVPAITATTYLATMLCTPEGQMVPPSTLYLTPSSAALMGNPVFAVVGTRGEIQLRVLDDEDLEPAVFKLNTTSPVTAIVSGKLSSQDWEIIAICGDGSTIGVSLPRINHKPSIQFEQLIQANVASAFIGDVDNDGNEELVVVMTDRVVRTFRWCPQGQRLIAINKWEIPNQISAIAVSEMGNGLGLWLSQLGSVYYVCLPLSGDEKEHVTLSTQIESKNPSVVALPYKSVFSQVLGALMDFVILYVGKREKILVNEGWPLVAVASATLPEFHCVATIDLRGIVFLYLVDQKVANRPDSTTIRPTAFFQSVMNCHHLAVSIDPEEFVLAVATGEGLLNVHSIKIADLCNLLNRPTIASESASRAILNK